MGAWIEIREKDDKDSYIVWSHPVWVRGLKYKRTGKYRAYIFVSHPVWVRGLKCFHLPYDTLCPRVAPRVGAWIEISLSAS